MIDEPFIGYVFVDIETGGKDDPAKEGLLQIAAIKTRLDFEILSYGMWYIKPPDNLAIHDAALAINGLTREQIALAMPEKEVALALESFVGRDKKYRVAGYNISFDLGYLDALAKRNFVLLNWGVPWLDLLPIARKHLGKETENHRLVTVCKHYGIDIEGAHDAMVDIHGTLKLARKFVDIGLNIAGPPF